MNEVLKVVLSMSLSGGIVIIMMCLVMLLFGKKLSRQWQYYIWLIAIARLLIPLAPQQNLMNVLFQSAGMAVSGMGNPSIEAIQNEQGKAIENETENGQWGDAKGETFDIKSQETDGEGFDETAGKGSDGKMVGKEQNILSNIVGQYLWLVWILPAFILLIRKIAVYESFIKYIHAGCQEVQDIILLEHFGKLLEKSHVRSTIELSVNNIVTSPIMIGFFRPCIVLPSLEMTDLEFEHTILHELVHYRRRDILYKWLTQFTVCIHWFNPLSYVLSWSINRACELSCDEAVIRRLDIQERRAYGDTLLRLAGRNVIYKNPVSSITFSNSKKNLKERLDAIMSFKKKTKAAFITALIVTVMTFICSSYIGVYAAGKPDVAVRDVIVTDTSKPKTSGVSSAQAPHSVLYKDGEYFILFDHADKKDIPGSTGPDYGITFTAVWPDASVSFDSYNINKNLTSKIEKDCTYMQKKGWLTKKEANAIIAVAFKVQKGDTDSFETDFEIDKYEKEYRQWNIWKRNGAYYYRNKRVRILIDMRKDRSFKNFCYDKKGKVDLKIVRGKDNSIVKVEYVSKKKADEIAKEIL